jgi:hypothetical protein
MINNEEWAGHGVLGPQAARADARDLRAARDCGEVRRISKMGRA